jgi:5-(carboxyamino)imidazole ribonucleotide synthase
MPMRDQIPLCPPYRIAIVGGGQLGKMTAQAAKQLGFHVTVLDPTPDSPASQVADSQVVAGFDDRDAIFSLVRAADVSTYEFEHIDSQALVDLEAMGHAIFPRPGLLRIIQDKLAQKRALQAAGIPVPPFRPVSSSGDIAAAHLDYGFPLMLKSCRGGYDGKGNFLVRDESDIGPALLSLGGCALMAEEFITFESEVSMMVARGRDGGMRTYPLAENRHWESILRRTVVPARVTEAVARRADEVARHVMDSLGGVGVFCVEMFVTATGEVLVNEVAPRPHNSGHYTIEACNTSQFEQQVRVITGLPLGDTSLRSPAVMVNLLGEEGHSGPALLSGCAQALALPGLHLHFYGKHQTAPRRKMGHFTVTAPDLDQAIRTADRAERFFRVTADNNTGGGEND